MLRKTTYHMSYKQIRLTLEQLEERKSSVELTGEAGDYSFAKIATRVGVSPEAIRLVSFRDMSPNAQLTRKMAQYQSASLMSQSDETVAAGWIVCHDLLRLNTSVEAFRSHLGSFSLDLYQVFCKFVVLF